MKLHEIRCIGFAKNFFECEEHCPFDTNSSEAMIKTDKNYTVFGDSKCQYRITDETAKVMNLYIDKDNELLVYHSYDRFDESNTDRRNKRFS